MPNIIEETINKIDTMVLFFRQIKPKLEKLEQQLKEEAKYSKECPKCHSKNTTKIIYGLPAFDKTPKEDNHVYGGCCIGTFSPAYHCRKCDKEWGFYFHDCTPEYVNRIEKYLEYYKNINKPNLSELKELLKNLVSLKDELIKDSVDNEPLRKIMGNEEANMSYFEEDANDDEIKKLIDRTNPVYSENLELKVEADLEFGSYNFYFKNKKNEENCIRLTSYVDDISIVLKFLCNLIEITNPICNFVNDEGETGIFYAKPINDNQIHFVVADDYELYENFCKNDVHYSYADAHICLDIIIDKKQLLKQFYDKIWEQTKNYKTAKVDYSLWRGIEEEHLELFDKIKKYLEEN